MGSAGSWVMQAPDESHGGLHLEEVEMISGVIDEGRPDDDGGYKRSSRF
jgi:hypothetical protein